MGFNEINERKNKARIRKQLYRDRQSDERKKEQLAANAVRMKEKRFKESDEEHLKRKTSDCFRKRIKKNKELGMDYEINDEIKCIIN